MKGHNFTDITFEKNIGGKDVTVHVNTVSTKKDGSFEEREATAASKINQKLWKVDSSQPLLITIPKGELTEETLGKTLGRRLDEIEEYYRNI